MRILSNLTKTFFIYVICVIFNFLKRADNKPAKNSKLKIEIFRANALNMTMWIIFLPQSYSKLFQAKSLRRFFGIHFVVLLKFALNLGQKGR